jgi:hypothetical protein
LCLFLGPGALQWLHGLGKWKVECGACDFWCPSEIILFGKSSHSRRIFIGSHSLLPPWSPNRSFTSGGPRLSAWAAGSDAPLAMAFRRSSDDGKGSYKRGSVWRSSCSGGEQNRRTAGGTEMRRPARLATACCVGEERWRLEQLGHSGLEVTAL